VFAARQTGRVTAITGRFVIPPVKCESRNFMEAETIQRDAPKASSMGGRTPLVRLAIQAVSAGISPLSIINSALVPGRETVGEQFATRQMFLPDMMPSAEAVLATKAVLKVEFRKHGIWNRAADGGCCCPGHIQGGHSRDTQATGRNTACRQRF
jgi:hypothetical protein